MDKISSLKKIFYLILISLFLYSAYWIYISFVFKNEVNNEIIRHGIQTQKIYVTGFPYRLEAHITNLSLEKEAENFFSINVPQIKISVSPFSFKKIFIQSNSSNLKYRSFTQDIDSMFTVDLQYNYTFDFNSEDDLKLTLGVKNAFDEEVPQVYDAANWSYDPKHHDPRGRMISVGLKLTM